MSDEQAAAAAPAPPVDQQPPAPVDAPAVPPADDGEDRVPYHRFKAVNDKAKEFEKQLRDMQARLDERESADLNETQKLQKQLERTAAERAELERRAADAEQNLIRLERGAWIRDAAQRAGFADPSDAVAFINDLEDIDRPNAAERAVKKLADAKPHLLAKQVDAPRVLGNLLAPANGAPTVTTTAGLSPDEALKQQQANEVLAAIKAAKGQ